MKEEVIDYLMLPAPKKMEINSNKIAELEKSVYKLQIASDTKIDIIKYFREKNPDKIQELRSRIVYSMFNSETALVLSNTERHDIHSWYNMMLEKLEPNIENLINCRASHCKHIFNSFGTSEYSC